MIKPGLLQAQGKPTGSAEQFKGFNHSKSPPTE
jgi:hypothetical protein